VVARPGVWFLFAAVAVVMLVIDQVTKHLAVARLTDRPDVSVVGEILQLHLTYNPGAAFSLGTEYTVAISCLAIVASVVVLWFSRRLADRLWAVALGFTFAGITGNLVDRMIQDPGPFRGEVVDFLMLPNWPVFNVADICINVGIGLVLLQTFRGVGLDGQRAVAAQGAEDTDEDA
jgi:signal peptidase II